MLTLSLNNQFIPVSSDFSVQITWKNPATDFEKIPSGYGLGFTFPINEYTRSIFGNPQRFAKYRSDNDQKFPGFEVRFAGVLLMAGTLQINSATDENYEATLMDQIGVLGEKEQERYLTDIPLFSSLRYFEKKTQYSPDTDAYCCFPVTNPDFFKEKGYVIELTHKVPDPNDATKQVDEKYDTELLTHLFERTQATILGDLFGSRINNTGDSGTDIKQFNSLIQLSDKANLKDGIPENSKVSVVTPFYFLNWILKMALRDNSFFLTSDNFLTTNEALKNLCIYNNFDITDMTFINGDIWTYFFRNLSGNIKTAVGKGITWYMRGYSNLMFPKNHLPKMKLGDAILSIQNLFNVCCHFLPNGTVNVFSRDAIIQGNSIDLDDWFLGTWEIGEKKKVALKFTREHDDDDLIFSERYTDLSDRRADIKAPVDDWDDLKLLGSSKVGDIRYVNNSGIFAEYKWISVSADDPVTKKPQTNDVLGWEEISIGLQNGWYEFGREEVEEIKTSWSTLNSGYPDPQARQSGNTSAWPAKKQSFSPRLLFMQPGGLYGNNAYNGYYVSADDVLYMEYEKETNGLFARLWKAWNPFWANRLPVTGVFDLPVNALWYLSRNICKKYRTREGEFIIDEMSCELFVDHIGPVRIQGFKVD